MGIHLNARDPAIVLVPQRIVDRLSMLLVIEPRTRVGRKASLRDWVAGE